MTRKFLFAKIHRATVTQVELHYTGSITIDANLLDASGIVENELVQVLNINNGQRFETYVIRGEPGSGSICLNGAAARLAMVGDKVIIVSYCDLLPNEILSHKPKVVHVDAQNRQTD